ncbi:MAG: hypothetical protein Q9195_007126, partial [Heterodermia aff. obscurata]
MDPNQAYHQHGANQALWHGQDTRILKHKWAEVVARHKGQPLPKPPTPEPQPQPQPQPPPTTIRPYFPTTHSTALGSPVRPGHWRDIPGYPPSFAPLPPGIGSAELVASYPNHLHGRVLLDVMVHFTPKEIGDLCPAKEINRFMIASRV